MAVKSGRFHGRFHEIWQISCEIQWISCMKSADFMPDLEKCKLENVKF